MLKKLQKAYDKSLVTKITIVTLVVLLSMIIMIPLVIIAEMCGVNIRENTGLNFKVSLGNVFFFFLFGISSIAIIWGAQKYIHLKPLRELGLRSPLLYPVTFGFFTGAFICSLRYLIFILNADTVEFSSVIPDNISTISYLGYYIYFLIGFIFWNSFIEELGTRAYPIEKLKNHMNPYLIFSITSLLFTLGHFVLNEFSIGYLLSLFSIAYIYSLLYYYSNSIWLVVGMHSGFNWIGFSFFGTNWKLGALYNTTISGIPDWITEYTSTIIHLTFLVLIVYLFKRGFFRKYFPQRDGGSK